MLHTIDTILFQWINQGISNPVFDAIMPWVREKWFWAPVYLYLLVFIIQQFTPRTATLLILGLVLSAGLSDLSSNIIKKTVQRTRPCNDTAWNASIQVRVPCGAGYSFTSSHAANHFAIALYLIAGVPVKPSKLAATRYSLLLWATLISFAQVYVGVHYPADVLTGAMLGAGIGWFLGKKIRSFLPIQ